MSIDILTHKLVRLVLNARSPHSHADKFITFTTMLIEGPVSLHIKNISHDLVLYRNLVHVLYSDSGAWECNPLLSRQRLSTGGLEWLLSEPTYSICYNLMSIGRWQSLLCTIEKKMSNNHLLSGPHSWKMGP